MKNVFQSCVPEAIGALLDLNVVDEAFETTSEDIYHPRPSAKQPSRSTAKFNHNLPLVIQVTGQVHSALVLTSD